MLPRGPAHHQQHVVSVALVCRDFNALTALLTPNPGRLHATPPEGLARRERVAFSPADFDIRAAREAGVRRSRRA